MWRRSTSICILTVLMLAALCACASAARLVWDANAEPHLRGYKIHYGSASGQYTNTVDVGNVTEWPIPDEWPRDRTYYFAATAYAECLDAEQQPYICESGHSNEAVYYAEATPPSPATDVRVEWRDLGEPTMAAEITGTAQSLNADDPYSGSITIPLDAATVWIGILYMDWSATPDDPQVTINGQSATKIIGGSTGSYVAMAYRINTAICGTGSQTLAIDFDDLQKGAKILVVYTKGNDTADPVRGSDYHKAQATSITTDAFTSAPGDLCILFVGCWEETLTVTGGSQTELLSSSTYNLISAAAAYKDADDITETMTASLGNLDDTMAVAFSIKPAATASAVPVHLIQRNSMAQLMGR